MKAFSGVSLACITHLKVAGVFAFIAVMCALEVMFLGYIAFDLRGNQLFGVTIVALFLGIIAPLTFFWLDIIRKTVLGPHGEYYQRDAFVNPNATLDRIIQGMLRIFEVVYEMFFPPHGKGRNFFTFILYLPLIPFALWVLIPCFVLTSVLLYLEYRSNAQTT